MGQFTRFSYSKLVKSQLAVNYFDQILNFNSDNELGGGGFLMNATNGFRNRNRDWNCNITTAIVLVCNSSAVWSSRDLTKIFHVDKHGPCEVTL
jgi:hypothetical protein